MAIHRSRRAVSEWDLRETLIRCALCGAAACASMECDALTRRRAMAAQRIMILTETHTLRTDTEPKSPAATAAEVRRHEAHPCARGTARTGLASDRRHASAARSAGAA